MARPVAPPGAPGQNACPPGAAVPVSRQVSAGPPPTGTRPGSGSSPSPPMSPPSAATSAWSPTSATPPPPSSTTPTPRPRKQVPADFYAGANTGTVADGKGTGANGTGNPQKSARFGDMCVFEQSDGQRRRFGSLRQHTAAAHQPDAVPHREQAAPPGQSPRHPRKAANLPHVPRRGPPSPTTPQPQPGNCRTRTLGDQVPDQEKRQAASPTLPNHPI
jgi:hypothetical protein